MNYPDFQAQVYPTGSGTVQSGVRQFKQRLTGAGMRWNAASADRMVIRDAVLGGDFDTLRDAA
jgi:hypothetical protein